MMILLTGGAACGKSHLAEELVTCFPGARTYIATMRPWGADGQAKVAKHRAMRQGKGFHTVECYGGLANVRLDDPHGVVLLECVTNLVADELYDDNGAEQPYDQVLHAVLNGVRSMRSQSDNLVVITNDVGSDGMRYDASTQSYIRLLGQANCLIAAEADVVVDMTCGIPQVVKGTLPVREGACV